MSCDIEGPEARTQASAPCVRSGVAKVSWTLRHIVLSEVGGRLVGRDDVASILLRGPSSPGASVS